jgi:hypothetical protein
MKRTIKKLPIKIRGKIRNDLGLLRAYTIKYPKIRKKKLTATTLDDFLSPHHREEIELKKKKKEYRV